MNFLYTILSMFIPVARAAGESNDDVASHSNSLATTIDSIERTSNIIDQYGVAIAILAVFIVVFLIVLFVIIMNNRKLMNRIMDMNQNPPVDVEKVVKDTLDSYADKYTELIEKAESETIKKSIEEGFKKEKESHKKAIQVNIDTYSVFKEASKDVVDRLHCQRVAIYLLHNGNETPYGYPFAKLTCAHEYTSRGTCSTPRGMSHMSVPLYAFSVMIESLMEDGEYRIDSINNENNFRSEEEKHQLMDFIGNAHVGSLYALAIKDNDHVAAAFTIVEFQEQQSFDFYNLEELRDALGDMNKIIRPIVLNHSFVDSYEVHHNEEKENE